MHFCYYSTQEACSLQYYFLILWRILGILPPSKAYIEQLKTGFGDPSESDILHTLRWSSRLRVSTYVNWIKVSPSTVAHIIALSEKTIFISFQQVVFSCVCSILKSNLCKNTPFPYIDVCFVTIGTPGALGETGDEGRPGIGSGWDNSRKVQHGEVWCGTGWGVHSQTGNIYNVNWCAVCKKRISDDNWSFLSFNQLFLLQISTFSNVDPNVIVPLHQLPSLQAIYTLDAVISKVQVSLDEHMSKVSIEAGTHKSSEITKNLLPATLQLTDVYTAFTR